MKALIVDDEKPVRELISFNVSREGFEALEAATGRQALEMASKARPDIIILDLMLPDMSGLDVCRDLKADKALAGIPIVMASAKDDDSDIVSGLELGADDYVTKPFSPKVLIARIRSVLRRAQRQSAEPPEEITAGPVRIIPKKHEVLVNGKSAALSAAEFSILLFLAEHPGQVFSRQQIISAVKGEGYPVTDRSVDVQILSIRRKIGDTPERSAARNSSYIMEESCEKPRPPLIETIRGVGYRLREDA